VKATVAGTGMLWLDSIFAIVRIPPRRLGPFGISLARFARSMPSLHQLLPEYACIEHGGDLARTTEVTIPELDRGMVAHAMRFHTDLHYAEARRRGSLLATYPIVGIGQAAAPWPPPSACWHRAPTNRRHWGRSRFSLYPGQQRHPGVGLKSLLGMERHRGRLLHSRPASPNRLARFLSDSESKVGASARAQLPLRCGEHDHA
jgi:hypothetical protein